MVPSSTYDRAGESFTLTRSLDEYLTPLRATVKEKKPTRLLQSFSVISQNDSPAESHPGHFHRLPQPPPSEPPAAMS